MLAQRGSTRVAAARVHPSSGVLERLGVDPCHGDFNRALLAGCICPGVGHPVAHEEQAAPDPSVVHRRRRQRDWTGAGRAGQYQDGDIVDDLVGVVLGMGMDGCDVDRRAGPRPVRVASHEVAEPAGTGDALQAVSRRDDDGRRHERARAERLALLHQGADGAVAALSLSAYDAGLHTAQTTVVLRFDVGASCRPTNDRERRKEDQCRPAARTDLSF